MSETEHKENTEQPQNSDVPKPEEPESIPPPSDSK